MAIVQKQVDIISSISRLEEKDNTKTYVNYPIGAELRHIKSVLGNGGPNNLEDLTLLGLNKVTRKFNANAYEITETHYTKPDNIKKVGDTKIDPDEASTNYYILETHSPKGPGNSLTIEAFYDDKLITLQQGNIQFKRTDGSNYKAKIINGNTNYIDEKGQILRITSDKNDNYYVKQTLFYMYYDNEEEKKYKKQPIAEKSVYTVSGEYKDSDGNLNTNAQTVEKITYFSSTESNETTGGNN